MKSATKCFLLCIALVSMSFTRQQQQVNEWVYERENKGIKVFTKKGSWGKLRDAKAVMVVPTSVNEMVKLLTDFDNYPNWLARCKKAKVLARLSDNEFIAHFTFDAPWPVADRDCVLRVKIKKDDSSGVVTITETSEPKYIKSEEGVVRIEQMVSTWKLIPHADGTEVINEYSSNPGGTIPDWLTNTQSVDAPMETFEGLKTRTSSKK